MQLYPNVFLSRSESSKRGASADAYKFTKISSTGTLSQAVEDTRVYGCESMSAEPYEFPFALLKVIARRIVGIELGLPAQPTNIHVHKRNSRIQRAMDLPSQ
ncbi:hypothetical protein ACJZ2D_001647 [Fusarium nematophilum]